MAAKMGMMFLVVCLAGLMVATAAEGGPPRYAAGMYPVMGHHPFHHYYPTYPSPHPRSYGPPAWHHRGPRGPVAVPVYPRAYRYAPYPPPGNQFYYGGRGWGFSVQF
ncbi:MAG: hypothetical protein JW809_15375 [Pirellulales bacterium]|nr:hypothetical protein [Pirellulales bacterium]